jgi:hypothetical protein
MNQPTPSPSQEGSRIAGARRQFPSWEGLGVGSGDQCAQKNSWDSPPEPRNSRRKEAQSISGERSQSLLTSAATVLGFKARSVLENSPPARNEWEEGRGEGKLSKATTLIFKKTASSPPALTSLGGGEGVGVSRLLVRVQDCAPF